MKLVLVDLLLLVLLGGDSSQTLAGDKPVP